MLSQRIPSNNLVVVTGITRSGKSMLAPIISALKRSENLKTDYTLEEFPVLNYLGLMSNETTVYLMRYLVNIIIYNNMIGRNTNLRFSDWTSIWNTADPKKYLERFNKEEGEKVYDRIEKIIHYIFSCFIMHYGTQKYFLKRFQI